MKSNTWMSWSSGKDSAYALYELKKSNALPVTGLFTTVTEDYNRVSMHSTRVELLEKQAGAIGLPLHIVYIPANCNDPCGENGKFHSFVFDSPIFRSPIPIKIGEQRKDREFVFTDVSLMPLLDRRTERTTLEPNGVK